jgi:hypothetical protein
MTKTTRAQAAAQLAAAMGRTPEEVEAVFADLDQLAAARARVGGTHRHTDWCPTPTGHEGDCWVENNRVLGIKPGPGITVVDLTKEA